jgi:hypothetical protein
MTIYPWMLSSRWPSVWITCLDNSCPYCGRKGNQLQWCPNSGSTRAEGRSCDLPSPRVGVSIPLSSFSDKLFLVPISLASVLYSSSGLRCRRNFFDQVLAYSLNTTSNLLSSPFPVQALDMRPLGSGTITHTMSTHV